MELFKDEFEGINRETAEALKSRLQDVIRLFDRAHNAKLQDPDRAELLFYDLVSEISTIFATARYLKPDFEVDKDPS